MDERVGKVAAFRGNWKLSDLPDSAHRGILVN